MRKEVYKNLFESELESLVRVGSYNNLQKLFTDTQFRFIVPQRVYEEIIRAKKEGYGFVDYVH